MGSIAFSLARLGRAGNRVVLEAEHRQAGINSIKPTSLNPNATEDAHLDSPLEVALEKLLNACSEACGNDELVAAKEEFFLRTGKVFPEDTFFDERMNYFLDYFLFERPLSEKCGRFARAIPYKSFSTQAPEISGFRHSIFQITKIGSNSLTVTDWLSGDKLIITAKIDESFVAVRKKEIFQGFLFDLQGKTYLSRGLVFHSDKATRGIKGFIKTMRKQAAEQRDKILSFLANTQLRQQRHGHVDPRLIYDSEIKRQLSAS